jgi:hypothetical protein
MMTGIFAVAATKQLLTLLLLNQMREIELMLFLSPWSREVKTAVIIDNPIKQHSARINN